MNGKTKLVDIRQIGPASERDISGVCSACGMTLLVRIDSVRVPTREQLEDALLKLFAAHVAESHERPNGKAEQQELPDAPPTN